MSLAFIFPGQGAQAVGMGRALYERYAVARGVIDVAAEACGLDLPRLCFEGPADRLEETEVTQPALLAVSAAVVAVLAAEGVRPQAVAGLSLGEYGALLCANAAELTALSALVRLRGRCMQEAVPIGVGGMAAVVGLGREGVEALCLRALNALSAEGEAPAGGWVLTPANYNCPGQIVISGHLPAVRRAVALGRDCGARRVQLLPVSAPFHSALMLPAEERLRPAIEAVAWRAPEIPVVANVHAQVVSGAPEVRAALVRQVSQPVLWEDCVRRLATLGCDTFVEVGPGRALTGFVGRILPSARALAVSDLEGVAGVMAMAVER